MKKLFSILYYMMKTNLLDLNNDILNIIGDCVKQDNADIMEKEEDFKYADKGMDYLKENNKFVEEEINEIIYDRLFKGGCSYENIDEYRKTRNF